jgi:hypothetical protein
MLGAMSALFFVLLGPLARCWPAVGGLSDARVEMKAWKRITTAALAGLLLLPAGSAAAATKRPRPSEVPGAVTAVAPNDFQVYNDYASPERRYASRSVVVHYVVLGIDAPPLNDDDLDAVPDYVERVGEAADRALAYYERRGFHTVLPDTGGPDARPDLYLSRFSPGTLGVAFPSGRAEGGAFAVIANNLDPSPERSFASVYATVAHELFHLVQFSYFGPNADPPIPTWILEGTAAALESRANPELDDLVTTLQLRRWFAATDRSLTEQSYGAQLLWGQLDAEQPRFLPALLARLASNPVSGEGQHAVATTFARVAAEPFAPAFHRFALSVARDHADELEPFRATGRGRLAPLSVRYLRIGAAGTLTVRLPRGEGAAASLLYRVESDVPGRAPTTQQVAPRVGDRGRTLSFTVRSGSRRSALLVLSNGGERPVAYAVSAR